MKPHADADLMRKLFPAVRTYQDLATKHGIEDIFQDNGGKILQVCLILGLKVVGSREGNDAVDADGNEYQVIIYGPGRQEWASGRSGVA
jgi:hypothetical protein